ncbi:hypothetical protein VARIO8X_60309 [Burkholderiales bacterium 8X]|nr:hypothetical protein VARIO8X_60309 [Burkholderiales bacterium 8X]
MLFPTPGRPPRTISMGSFNIEPVRYFSGLCLAMAEVARPLGSLSATRNRWAASFNLWVSALASARIFLLSLTT